MAAFLAACAGPGAEPSGRAELVEGLTAAGADVEEAGSVEQAFFSVEGTILRVNGADVQVFEYVDAAAREADSTQISADGSSVGTTMITWTDRPHFFARGKLIVLYVGSDQPIVDVLSEVLGPAISSPGY